MSFTANYEGRCTSCHRPIYVGQEISGTPDDGYRHVPRCPPAIAVEHDRDKRREQRRQARARAREAGK